MRERTMVSNTADKLSKKKTEKRQLVVISKSGIAVLIVDARP